MRVKRLMRVWRRNGWPWGYLLTFVTWQRRFLRAAQRDLLDEVNVDLGGEG